MKYETFISVILVMKNNNNYFLEYLDKLAPYLEKHYYDYEILIIDQISNDYNTNKIDNSLRRHKSIRHIFLSKIVSEEIAIAVGMENAIGDFIINLNIEFDSFKLVNKLVNKGVKGNDIIVCVSDKITSFLYKYFRNLSTSLLKQVGYALPKNSTGTFCFSRKTINIFSKTGSIDPKFYLKMGNTGFSICTFICDNFINHSYKKSILEGLSITFYILIFNSTKPLRWMSILGIFGSLLGILFSIYSLIINLINEEVTPGWTTMIFFMSSLFALLFTMLTFFGEYLARLLNDRNESKDYNIVLEKNSSVMINENRHNVLFKSNDNNVKK